jgi:hypothetical protein
VLVDEESLSYYIIQEGAMIHMVKSDSPVHNIETEQSPNLRSFRRSADLSRSPSETSRSPEVPTIESNDAEHSEPKQPEPEQPQPEGSEPKLTDADSHNTDLDFDQSFDDDNYLINPENHYKKLDILEKMVVETSEFYHAKGSYEPTLSHINRDGAFFTTFYCYTDVWRCLDRIADSSGLDVLPLGRTGFDPICAGLSLGKSYLILCHILDSLDILTQKEFCGDAFTILVQREPKHGDVAELVQIERKLVVEFHGAIASAILKILKPGRPLLSNAASSTISEILMPTCERFMEHLGAPLQAVLKVYDILVLCRILTLILDLGVVSYVGSHGSRFDLDFLAQDHSELRVTPQSKSNIGFRFSLKRLACLDEFLNNKPVWTFQLLWVVTRDSHLLDRPLSILTSIEAFADTWGPIWKVPAGKHFPNCIRQLNVSTGWICRTENAMSCSIEGATPCHWFNSSGGLPLPLPQDCDSALIRENQKLLIGGLNNSSLETNETCSYQLNDLETGYGLYMTPLGTATSSWTMSERQVGVSASQYIGVTLLGTQKKVPCTTQKQAIWNKWTNQPSRANPRILNSYLGVEISHCTGNARRIQLRELFAMKPVQALIGRQFPDWISSDFGLSLYKAFHSTEDTLIEETWVKHCKSRIQIAEIVCCVLEMLEKTGSVPGRFSAAFLNQNRELSMPLDLRLNSWAEFLEDSHLTAIYAIFNGRCLDGVELGNFISTCNSATSKSSSFTVLETQIAIPHAESSPDTLWLDQRGYLQRVSRSHDNVQIHTWDLGRARELRGKLGRFLGSNKCQNLSREVQDKCELGGRHISVLVKSTTPSFGGLPAKRATHVNALVDQALQDVEPLVSSLPIRSPASDPVQRIRSNYALQREEQWA